MKKLHRRPPLAFSGWGLWPQTPHLILFPLSQ